MPDIEQVRIQKYISDMGLMSRRAAEKAIEAGEFTVNGEKAVIGMKIIPGKDNVKHLGRSITRKKRTVYVLLNKPKGYVTTLSDEKGRKCVAELVSDVGERVYPAGRLDYESEGLLLLSNDGELVNRLMHPKHTVPKYYQVTVNAELTPEQRKKLSSAMNIDGYIIKPVRHRVLRCENGSTTLEMQLYEGRNRQIRKMCERIGVCVKRLRRVAIGEICIDDLPVGSWRYMTDAEIEYLKLQLGLG